MPTPPRSPISQDANGGANRRSTLILTAQVTISCLVISAMIFVAISLLFPRNRTPVPPRNYFAAVEGNMAQMTDYVAHMAPTWFSPSELRLLAELKRRWKASGESNAPPPVLVENDAVNYSSPPRTRCVDFLFSPWNGPPETSLVVAWTQVDRNFASDPVVPGRRWWTIAAHGPKREELSLESVNGVLLDSVIVDNTVGIPSAEPCPKAPVPSLTPKGIDQALATVDEVMATQGPLSLSKLLAAFDDKQLRQSVQQWEQVSLVRFLLMYLQLEEGDTVELFCCNLGRGPSGEIDRGPQELVKRLAFLNPKVRLVIYTDDVRWLSGRGYHIGASHATYRGNSLDGQSPK